MLTCSESALHFNVKMRLAASLEAAIGEASVLRVGSRCDRCTEGVESEWISGWTRVEVEFSLGSRRPDITLLRGQEVLGALEVHATHGVDEQKRKDLAEMGVEWVEVLADGDFLEQPYWSVEELLQVDATSFLDACASCRAEERRQEESERQRRASESAFVTKCIVGVTSAQEDGWIAKFTRAVVLYYPHGDFYNEHFALAVRRSGGANAAVSLFRLSQVKEPLFTLEQPIPRSPRVIPRADAAIRRFAKAGNTKMDMSGSWNSVQQAEAFSEDSVRALVSRGFAEWCVEEGSFIVSRLGFQVAAAAFLERGRRQPLRYVWHRRGEYWFKPRRRS